MLTVIGTPNFIRTAASIWNADEVQEFISYIADNSDLGDVIQGTKSLRKIRWSRSGMGKRGGARVIYFVRTKLGEIVLITAFSKGETDNLPTAFLNRLKELYDA